jgi:hypothetical protein
MKELYILMIQQFPRNEGYLVSFMKEKEDHSLTRITKKEYDDIMK